MGYILEEIAEDHQRVRGVIIALDDDKRIRRALQIAKGIDFLPLRGQVQPDPCLLTLEGG